MHFSPRERLCAQALLARSFYEDKADRDLTSGISCPKEKAGRFFLRTRQDIVVSGLEAVSFGFKFLEGGVEAELLKTDGDRAAKGETLAVVSGPVAPILSCERTVLNLLQRMCGVATLTARYVAASEGLVKIVDTRKTLPGFRLLDKYAVRCGGGANHRLDLSDMIMLKDNHLAYSGLSYAELFEKARREHPGVPVAVEAENYDQALELSALKPDILMLDNIPAEEMKRIAEALEGKVVLEATGGVTLDNLYEIARCGVQRISIGAITHSATAVDLGLDA
ncbi:carboxylating nicotinate-nucleotide diphosphorylase [bacterium]|nr:carboxylating nicotinate-nucleotide diphosphorylase [bacterium]